MTTTNSESVTVTAVLGQAEAWTTATSTVNAPSGAEDFSMIWTGKEIVIWGGTVAVGPVTTNAGHRYDPATDLWLGDLSTAGAPSSRWGHTAVWTGSEMIIWGGATSTFGLLNDGYRYNPRSDTWSGPISAVSAPAGRRSHSAIWTGTEMIVWGGADATTALNSGASYNPVTDSWTPLSTVGAPTARWHHTAVWTGTDLLIWGGFDGANAVNTGGSFRPSTGNWLGALSTIGAPASRLSHSAVWTDSEMIVWGGEPGGSTSGFNTGGRYDPNLDSWQPTTVTNAASSRWSHQAVWTGLEMIVWGGSPGLVNTGKRYLPSITLAAGTHTGTVVFTDPFASNSPQFVSVLFVVEP